MKNPPKSDVDDLDLSSDDENVSDIATPSHTLSDEKEPGHISDSETHSAESSLVVLRDPDSGAEETSAPAKPTDYQNDIVELDISDESDGNYSMDAELAEKIKERENRKKKQDKVAAFSVGVIFRSLIPQLADQVITLKVQSNVQFRQIRADYIKKIQESGKHAGKKPTISKTLYSDLVMVWKNTRIFGSATPYSVGVKLSSPSMMIETMTEEQYKDMEERAVRMASAEVAEKNTTPFIELDGTAEEVDSQNNYNEVVNYEDTEEGYFRVGLKGKDNQAVYVKVNADTQISKLADYYKAQKSLPSAVEIRLEFDDELLNFSDKVGDTELEEDFTIDVHLV